MPHGEAADIITSTRSGLVVIPDDIEAIERQLNTLVTSSADNSSFQPDYKAIDTYRLENQQAKLIDVFRSL